ncbi:MAG: alpha/beta hydrolase [Candidatus Omnitrophica bacterium]|nr:alpha/beta hydrolase [Candidatus Omnitrophota bacterium]
MLAYEAAGEGPPLVFLHAYPLSSAMWKGEIQVFSRTHRVIAPDLAGFGRSPRQERPSMADMARGVRDLLDALWIREPVILAGISMGGYVAFEFYRQFPERVRALGLFSTRASTDAAGARKGRLEMAKRIRKEGLAFLPDVMMPKLLGNSTRAKNQRLAGALSRLILNNEKFGVADSLIAMAERRDSTDLLPRIMCPTLIVAGDEDEVISLDEAYLMQKGIPHSRLQVIQEAGHLINLEQPEPFQNALDKFLKDLGTGQLPAA